MQFGFTLSFIKAETWGEKKEMGGRGWGWGEIVGWGTVGMLLGGKKTEEVRVKEMARGWEERWDRGRGKEALGQLGVKDAPLCFLPLKSHRSREHQRPCSFLVAPLLRVPRPQ